MPLELILDLDIEKPKEGVIMFKKILLEEAKKEGIEIAEEVLEQVVDCVLHKVLPRLAVEEDQAVIKGIALAALPIVAALQPMIDKATDLNHDGK